MSPVLFWICAMLMLAFGVAVIVNRNPVASALSLVASFFCLAALFVGLWRDSKELFVCVGSVGKSLKPA